MRVAKENLPRQIREGRCEKRSRNIEKTKDIGRRSLGEEKGHINGPNIAVLHFLSFGSLHK